MNVVLIPTSILIKLSNYYNVSIDYILGLTDKKVKIDEKSKIGIK